MKKYIIYSSVVTTLLSIISLLFIGNKSAVVNTINISNSNLEIFSSGTNKQLSSEEIYTIAQEISVKIMSGDGEFLGSGVLLQKQDRTYTVITNAHVLRGNVSSLPYQIETNDLKVHKVKRFITQDFGELDMALLKFTSFNETYEIPQIGEDPKLGDKVYTCGFPDVEEGVGKPKFLITKGEVLSILDPPKKDGYQIGHTNNIESGMSGGALLNSKGELVGIVGKHAYSAWKLGKLSKSSHTRSLRHLSFSILIGRTKKMRIPK
jgi:S1-C subfamily serine protease